MLNQPVTVTVPAKVMLAGEYAVLQGGAALAITLDPLLSTTVKPVSSPLVRVTSDLWPEIWQGRDSDLRGSKNLLLETTGAARAIFGLQNSGMEIDVTSQIKVAHGIGSSSALRLAVAIAMGRLSLGSNASEAARKERDEAALKLSYELQKSSQGFASGYDLLTQFCGGLVHSRPLATDVSWPNACDKVGGGAVALQKFVTVFVGGAGAPTTETGVSTLEWLSEDERQTTLMQNSENLVMAFLHMLYQDNHAAWRDLMVATAAHRRFFETSPRYPAALIREIAQIPGCDRDWSIKTTGAGGEDALLLIGHAPFTDEPTAKLRAQGWHPIDANFCETGYAVQ